MVIDASVAVPWLIETTFSASARKVRPPNPIAPSVMLVETASVLMKYSCGGLLSVDKVRQSVANLKALFAEFVPDHELLEDAVNISAGQRHPVYDCLYLALALERRETLATADRRLAIVGHSLGIDVVLIEPS